MATVSIAPEPPDQWSVIICVLWTEYSLLTKGDLWVTIWFLQIVLLRYLGVSECRYCGFWPFGMLRTLADTLTYSDFSLEKDIFKKFR